MSDIKQQVKKVIAGQLDIDESKLTDDATFTHDLGLDSLDTVELIMSLEEEFDCTIPDEDAEKMSTVKDVLDYVENKQAQSQD